MNGELPLDLADTANLFLVATDFKRERVVIGPIGGTINRREALNLAAWIIALLEPDCRDFNRLLEAIKKA